MIRRNKSNLPFFYGILSRIDGDTHYVALYNTDNATITELPVQLSAIYTNSGKPLPIPGTSVECFYDHAQIFIVGPAPTYVRRVHRIAFTIEDFV